MSGFFQVVQLGVAKARLSEMWRPQTKDTVLRISDAFGRVASSDVVSKIDVPPFDRATYDGYSVKSSDTFRATESSPVSLKLVGWVRAGTWPRFRIKTGCCAEISTGAPLPKGSDAVVMSEHATADDKRVTIYRAVAPFENVTRAGSDIKKGQKVVVRGKCLGAADIATLAAVGVEKVRVVKKPKVAIISTGSELVRPGEKLSGGKVYDVNGPALSEAVKLCGAEPVYLGIAPDEKSKIKGLVSKGLKISDVVLISGGSSVGTGDLVPKVIDGMGKPGVTVHGIAMKPGKPTYIAMLHNKPIFGLPGYPVSSLMVFDQLVADFIHKLSGTVREKRNEVRARLSTRLLSARGRHELVPVRLVYRDGERFAEPILKGSGAITSLSSADGYIEIPIEREMVDEGENVVVKLFGSGLS
jgi:molybdenum cofactor synthesis domain-containing protein